MGSRDVLMGKLGRMDDDVEVRLSLGFGALTCPRG